MKERIRTVAVNCTLQIDEEFWKTLPKATQQYFLEVLEEEFAKTAYRVNVEFFGFQPSSKNDCPTDPEKT